MKKTTLSILLLGLFSLIFGQQEDRTYDLNITDITVKYNGKENRIDNMSFKLTTKEARDLILYKEDNNTYLLNARILIRGNRIKLRFQNYVITSDGKKIKGKYRKLVHYLKQGVDNTFEGNGTENILIDNKKLLAMKLIYKYQLQYTK